MVSGANGSYISPSTHKKTSNKQTHTLKLTCSHGFDNITAIILLTFFPHHILARKSRCKYLQILLDTETYLISPLISCKNIVIAKAEILKVHEEKGLGYHRKGIKNQQR